MQLIIVIFNCTFQNKDLHGINVTFMSTPETFYFMRLEVLWNLRILIFKAIFNDVSILNCQRLFSVFLSKYMT